MTPLLRAEDLRVAFPARNRVTEAVRGVNFEIGREKVGLVGESGSGKSTIGRALLRLTPGIVSARRLEFAGTDLLRASEADMRRLRGRRISMILQDPRFSLNPVMTVGRQVAETWRAHFQGTDSEARQHARAMLESCGLRDWSRAAARAHRARKAPEGAR